MAGVVNEEVVLYQKCMSAYGQFFKDAFQPSHTMHGDKLGQGNHSVPSTQCICLSPEHIRDGKGLCGSLYNKNIFQNSFTSFL